MRLQQGKNEESGKEPGTCQVGTCQPWLGKRICFKGNGCYYRVLNRVWMQSDLCFKRIFWARLGRKGRWRARWKEGDELGAYFHSWDNWQSWRSLVSGKSMQTHLLTLSSHQCRQNFKWGFQFFKKIHEAIVIIFYFTKDSFGRPEEGGPFISPSPQQAMLTVSCDHYALPCSCLVDSSLFPSRSLLPAP